MGILCKSYLVVSYYNLNNLFDVKENNNLKDLENKLFKFLKEFKRIPKRSNGSYETKLYNKLTNLKQLKKKSNKWNENLDKKAKELGFDYLFG